MPRIALTRPVSAAFARCELTHLAREPIDVARALRQHEGYEALLEELGCALLRLREEPDLPDSVFVEDAAFVVARNISHAAHASSSSCMKKSP